MVAANNLFSACAGSEVAHNVAGLEIPHSRNWTRRFQRIRDIDASAKRRDCEVACVRYATNPLSTRFLRSKLADVGQSLLTVLYVHIADDAPCVDGSTVFVPYRSVRLLNAPEPVILLSENGQLVIEPREAFITLYLSTDPRSIHGCDTTDEAKLFDVVNADQPTFLILAFGNGLFPWDLSSDLL